MHPSPFCIPTLDGNNGLELGFWCLCLRELNTKHRKITQRDKIINKINNINKIYKISHEIYLKSFQDPNRDGRFTTFGFGFSPNQNVCDVQNLASNDMRHFGKAKWPKHDRFTDVHVVTVHAYNVVV